jgi:hypothetical protein
MAGERSKKNGGEIAMGWGSKGSKGWVSGKQAAKKAADAHRKADMRAAKRGNKKAQDRVRKNGQKDNGGFWA